MPDDIYTDSVTALDMSTGAIRWTKRMIDYEAWNLVQFVLCVRPFYYFFIKLSFCLLLYI